MPVEIERKFLVTNEGWRTGQPTTYVQGYLNRDKERTVRIRVAGETAMITIKGPTIGISRAEYEYMIPVSDAQEMLAMCDGPLIEKRRWLCDVGQHRWEVDEFLGDNAGLIVAEIELSREDEDFILPSWAGEDVTDDTRYANSNLSLHPFKTWSS